MLLARYAAVMGLGAALGIVFFMVLELRSVVSVHTLEQPLMLTGGSVENYPTLLPVGTTLYFDKAYPEGFVRYKMYINVEGVNLETTPLDDSTSIRPMYAFPLDKQMLVELLKGYPLSRDDTTILGSGALSRDEIREVLQEYVQR